MLLKIIQRIGFPIERIMVQTTKIMPEIPPSKELWNSVIRTVNEIFLKSHVIINRAALNEFTDESVRTITYCDVAKELYKAKQGFPLKLHLIQTFFRLLFIALFFKLCCSSSWMEAFGILKREEPESNEKDRRWYEILKNNLPAIPLCVMMLYPIAILLNSLSSWFSNAFYHYHYPQFDRMMGEIVGEQTYVDFLYEWYK